MIYVIGVGRDNAHFIHSFLAGLRQQTERHFTALLIDDCSTDGTGAILQQEVPRLGIKAKVVRNKERGWALFNKVIAPYQFLDFDDEDIILWCDMDDFLAPRAVEIVDKFFQTNDNIWFFYGGLSPLSGKWRGEDVAAPIDWKVPVRKQAWKTTHLRAVRWSLLKNILRKDLQDGQGQWLKYPEDRIVSYPLVEMAGEEHVYCYQGPVIYHYRDDNPASDSRENDDEIQAIVKELVAREQYPSKTKAELRGHDCDW